MKSLLKFKYLLKNKIPYPGILRPLHDRVNGETKNALNATTEILEDLHGRKHDYLRISLTERCNLRCQYCMPAEGVPLSPKSRLLSRDELLRLARVFAALGVTKVRLTGGEPTLRSDIVDIVQELSNLPGIRTVAMTSNGLALMRRLPALQRAGLSALNLSLDTLRPERFERMTRRTGLPRVLASIDLALQLGYSPVKVNTVLMKGFNDDEICDFADFTKDRDVEVRFIEFMPFSGNEWHDERMVPERAALAALRRRFPELRRERGAHCETASLWAAPGHRGRLGFISSMTRPFCAGCNRLRLTADGNLKVCLFGAAETSLRDALRAGASDDDLAALVRAALRRKLPQHAGQYLFSTSTRHRTPAARRSRRPNRNEKRRYLSREKSSYDPNRRVGWPAPRAPLGRGVSSWGVSRRAYSTGGGGGRLTHLDAEGRARMVDVGDKVETVREAEAECFVEVSEEVVRLLRAGGGPKGDALGVAQVAGVMAAKRTAELIPLCHALPLASVRVRVVLPEGATRRVRVSCVARARARTGVEMEALTGCALAALTLYDMCKAADRAMCITGLRVLRKSGGASDWTAPQDARDTRNTDSR